MDTQILHRLITLLASSPGEGLAMSMVVARLMAGGDGRASAVDYAAVLVMQAGPAVVPALIEAGAPPDILRAAIETAVTDRHWDLKEVDRATFAAWCQLAAFTAPENLPETVDIYRGTIGCSPAEAAKGLHWSLSFEDAAWFACRFADAALRGVVVLHARVPRTGIVAFIPGTAHQEVVPAEAPTAFEVITDAELIGDAAARCDHRLTELKAQGWASIKSFARSQQVAMAARARMATQPY